MTRTPETASPSTNAAEVMVEVIRLLQKLSDDEQERVYLAVGQFVGIHTTLTQHIADNLETLVEELQKRR